MEHGTDPELAQRLLRQGGHQLGNVIAQARDVLGIGMADGPHGPGHLSGIARHERCDQLNEVGTGLRRRVTDLPEVEHDQVTIGSGQIVSRVGIGVEDVTEQDQLQVCHHHPAGQLPAVDTGTIEDVVYGVFA